MTHAEYHSLNILGADTKLIYTPYYHILVPRLPRRKSLKLCCYYLILGFVPIGLSRWMDRCADYGELFRRVFDQLVWLLDLNCDCKGDVERYWVIGRW